MSTTYIRISCPHCHCSCRKAIYGYLEDPIGIPFTKCPNCNSVFKDKKHKEWMQMSPLKKYFSISPRGNIFSIFLAFVPLAFLANLTTTLPGIVVAGLALISFVLSHYIVVALRVNSWKCMDRIASSIIRTNNKDYRELLEKSGKIYDTSFPKILLINRANKALLAESAQNNKRKTVDIPTFGESINNYTSFGH